MGKLYLIRHAQSANNAVWDGGDNHPDRHPDPELTDLGHRQAEILAQHLAHPQGEPRQHPFLPLRGLDFGLTHIYCSLMTRSILTAEYIASVCNLGMQALADIFEKHGVYDLDHLGRKAGLPGPGREYFQQRFPRLELPVEFNDQGWWNRPAEDEAAFVTRMRAVVRQISQRLWSSDDCIALVAHGDFIDQFVNELMAVPRHQHNYDNHWVANWTFHNTSISRVDFVDGSHNVVYTNRIDHLPHDLVTW